MLLITIIKKIKPITNKGIELLISQDTANINYLNNVSQQKMNDSFIKLCFYDVVLPKCNGQEGIRTPDTVVRSHVL